MSKINNHFSFLSLPVNTVLTIVTKKIFQLFVCAICVTLLYLTMKILNNFMTFQLSVILSECKFTLFQTSDIHAIENKINNPIRLTCFKDQFYIYFEHPVNRTASVSNEQNGFMSYTIISFNKLHPLVYNLFNLNLHLK